MTALLVSMHNHSSFLITGEKIISSTNKWLFYHLMAEHFRFKSRGCPCDRHPSHPVEQKIKDKRACRRWETQQSEFIIDGMLSKPMASLGIHCYLCCCLQFLAGQRGWRRGGRGIKTVNFASLLFPMRCILFTSFLIRSVFFFHLEDTFDQCC